MDWTGIVKFLGGSTALLAAVGYIVKSIVSHFLKRDLASMENEIRSRSDRELQAFKGSQDKELQALRGSQEKALQSLRDAQEEKMEQLRQAHTRTLQEIKAQADERIENVRAALLRMERLESDILKNRDDAYGEIWKLTGAINMFGNPLPVDCETLSLGLTNWYFPKGRLLTEDSKSRYFLVQEVLNFLLVRGIQLKRPSGEVLYCGEQRPIDAVRDCRARLLGVAPKPNEGNYTIDELHACISHCKAKLSAAPHPAESQESAWLLLQFVMSAFRSCLVEELGTRNPVHARPTAEVTDAPRVETGSAGRVVSSSGAEHTG